MEAGLTGVHGAQLEAALGAVHVVNSNTSDLGVAPIHGTYHSIVVIFSVKITPHLGPSTMETIAQENQWRPQAGNATPIAAQVLIIVSGN